MDFFISYTLSSSSEEVTGVAPTEGSVSLERTSTSFELKADGMITRKYNLIVNYSTLFSTTLVRTGQKPKKHNAFVFHMTSKKRPFNAFHTKVRYCTPIYKVQLAQTLVMARGNSHHRSVTYAFARGQWCHS